MSSTDSGTETPVPARDNERFAAFPKKACGMIATVEEVRPGGNRWGYVGNSPPADAR